MTNQVPRYRMEASIHDAAPDDSESHFAMVAPVEALNGEWVKWEDVKRLLYVEPTPRPADERTLWECSRCKMFSGVSQAACVACGAKRNI